MSQLEFKVIKGKTNTYLFVRRGGSYFAFAGVPAKEAVSDCRATGSGTTREKCKQVWDKH